MAEYLVNDASLIKLADAVRENTGESGEMTIDEMSEKLNAGVVPINKGGTGATDAATARENLGAAAKSHGHNVSDVSGLGKAATKDIATVGGNVFNKVAYIAGDGVMEIGQYIDFHRQGSTSDYDLRLSVDGYGYPTFSKPVDSIKDAGDGRTLTFNYSAAGMNSAEWYAAWNGNQLQSIHRKKVGLESYPVGAVYISWSSTSPASLFGGSWTAITGRFPYFNNGTGTGGANTHKLTTSEMPSHNHQYWGNSNGHTIALSAYASNSAENVAFGWVNNNQLCFASRPTSGPITANQITGVSSGGNAAHNNMPAYQTLYAWRRTG